MFRRCRDSGELHIRRECGVQAFCRRQNLGADGIYFRPGRERFRAPVGRQPNGMIAAMRSEFHKGNQSIVTSDAAASGGDFKGGHSYAKNGPLWIPQETQGALPLDPRTAKFSSHFGDHMRAFSSERFGVLLFPLGRCCAGGTNCKPIKSQD